MKIGALILIFYQITSSAFGQMAPGQPAQPAGQAVPAGQAPQPGQPAGDPTQPHPPGHNFGDQNEITDQQHLKTHLDGQVDTNQQMSQEQMRYHYFKMHDLNNDNMLDGVELIKAITHYHGDPNTANAQQNTPPKLSDIELENIIDNILTQDDYNKDGYIDYAEFIKSQAGRG